MFRKEEHIMNIEEFKKLLKESGMTQELILKLDQIIKVINVNEDKLGSLEARVSKLEEKNSTE